MRVGEYLAVTNHAIERLEERMKISGYKNIQKAVRKAWFSKKEICIEFWKSRLNLKNNGCTTYHYRKYNNCIFCFQKKYYDVVLLTVFPEDGEFIKQEYASNTKKTFGRNQSRSVLPKMHSAQGTDVWGKDYFRTRHDLRRKADKREMGDFASMRKTPRRQQVSGSWRSGQAISRIRSGKQDDFE